VHFLGLKCAFFGFEVRIHTCTHIQMGLQWGQIFMSIISLFYLIIKVVDIPGVSCSGFFGMMHYVYAHSFDSSLSPLNMCELFRGKLHWGKFIFVQLNIIHIVLHSK